MVYPGGKIVHAVNFFSSFFLPFLGFLHVDQTRVFVFFFFLGGEFFFPKHNTLLNIQKN